MDDITTKHQPPHEDPDDNPRVAYEHGDADVFTVSKYAIALGFGVVIAASAMWGLFSWFEHQQTLEVTKLPATVLESRKSITPPEPRLQATPKLDLRQYRAAEEESLNEYKWLDGAAKILLGAGSFICRCENSRIGSTATLPRGASST